MKKKHCWWTGCLAIALWLGGSSGIACAGDIELPFDPDHFASPRDNTYLPMSHGRTYVYLAAEEDGLIVDEITQTNKKKNVLGVQTTVVHDAEWILVEGVGMILLEETFDWIAWDNDGNVWYFGEDSTEYEYDEEWNLEGTSKAGSWEAGVDGAVPGILMLADPSPGDSYRQEFAEGVAEDMGQVVNLSVTVTLEEFAEVEGTVFDDCLKTKEWTPLEPGSVEHKYYAPQLGLVLIEGHHGKAVITELVAIE